MTPQNPAIGKEGGSGSESSDDDSYDEIANEREGVSAPDINNSATAAFVIQSKEIGKW